MYRIFTSITLWLLFSATVFSQTTFINEIDYQGPAGCLEIVTPLDTDLSDWDIVIYDDQGNLQEIRDVIPITTTPLGTFGIIIVDAVIFSDPNNPGAIGLIDNNGNVIQFLSFDGPIVALDGPAIGVTSDPIGVQTSPTGSLQLAGTGDSADDFEWMAEDVASCGEVNVDQILNVQALAVLPVTLEYFNAQCENGIVEIKWRTLTEINADYFLVEKSANGRNWSILNHLEAAQNSTVARTYVTKDVNPTTGTNYYRLSQVDLDGTIEMFKIVAIKNHGMGTIKVFPNPTTSVINILLPGTDNYDNTKVFIRDMLGREKELNYQPMLDVSNLEPGTYYLRVVSNQNEYHQVFIRSER